MKAATLFGFLLVVAIAGIFIAPPYKYTHEETQLLKKEPSTADYFMWPIRAYDNWEACGNIRYCEAVRCAALGGGCRQVGPADVQPLLPTSFPSRDPAISDFVWGRTVQAWCAGFAAEYVRISDEIRRQSEDCAARKESARQLDAPGDIKLDISNLISCEPDLEPERRGDLLAYQEHCG